MSEVEFHAPVFVGDLVSFFTETMRVGRTSITVKVVVEAERWGAGQGERVRVTEAEVVLVAIGPDGQPDADCRNGSDADARSDDCRLRARDRSRTSPAASTSRALRSTPGDVVVAEASERPGVAIAAIHGDGGRLTRDPGAKHRRRGGAGAACSGSERPAASR